MATEKITQEKIINAVLECAFEKGTGATSLSDISEKLNIKKASLYNHYENREAIIDAATRYCADFILKTSFIPAEMDAAARKYSAEVILKGIATRWFKINCREPVLQVYSFLNSEKYFSTSAAKAVLDSNKKLTEQAQTALKSLSDAGKTPPLTPEKLEFYASLFISGLNAILDDTIILKKSELRFSDKDDGLDLTSVEAFVTRFCSIIQ